MKKKKRSQNKKLQIKKGDRVKATKDCGETKKGQIYQVVLDTKNGIGKPIRGILSINPIDHSPTHHSACTEIETWEKIDKPKLIKK